jgi:hypothetical protein
MPRTRKRAWWPVHRANATFTLAALLLVAGVFLQRALAGIVQDDVFASIVMLIVLAPLASLGSKRGMHR